MAATTRTKITEAAIADAVLEIGLDDATVKNVAEHIGVSAPGLYHHVNGRDDLRRIAIERVVATSTLPDPEGLSWSSWLRQVCRSLRALAARPEFLAQYAGGGVPVASNLVRIEEAVAVLRDAGFTLEGAVDAFHTIGQLAIGAATEDIREANYRRHGQPSGAQVHAAVALDPDAYPNMLELLTRRGLDLEDRFERRLDIVIAGISALNQTSSTSTSPMSEGS